MLVSEANGHAPTPTHADAVAQVPRKRVPEKTARDGSFIQSVYAFVKENPGCSQPQVRAGLENPGSVAVTSALHRLRTTGQIKNVGGQRHAARYKAV